MLATKVGEVGIEPTCPFGPHVYSMLPSHLVVCFYCRGRFPVQVMKAFSFLSQELPVGLEPTWLFRALPVLQTGA